MLRFPSIFRKLICFGLKLTGNSRIWNAIRTLKTMERPELEALMKRHLDLHIKMKEQWDELGINAVIMPNYPIPAFTSSNVEQVGSFRDYQILWSLLHYPCGVVPVT